MDDERVGEEPKPVRINLGSSDGLHPDFLNVDIWEPPNANKAAKAAAIRYKEGLTQKLCDAEIESLKYSAENTPNDFMQVDLDKSWPWPDSSVDQLRAHDIFEHLLCDKMKSSVPQKYPKIRLMNEAFRVLKPDATLDLFVPTTDGRGADQDPTHVTKWNINSLFYHCEVFAEWQRFRHNMGVTCNFRIPGGIDATSAMSILNSCHRQYGNNVTKLHIVLEAIK